MRKISALVLVALLSAGTAFAQVMVKDNQAVNLGIGLPKSHYGALSMPSLCFAYDRGFSPKLGIGYISGGAGVSISGERYSSSWGYNTRYRTLVMGPRAAYHFDFYDISGNEGFKKLDIYAGIFAGLRVSWWRTDYDNYYAGTKTASNSDAYFIHDVFAGIRYNLSPGFGFYAEAGYGVSFLNAGFTFRF
jgi:hypothetical protein